MSSLAKIVILLQEHEGDLGTFITSDLKETVRRCSLLALLIATSASAVTFTVTPNNVSNGYPGLIAFQIDGLSRANQLRLPSSTISIATDWWTASIRRSEETL